MSNQSSAPSSAQFSDPSSAQVSGQVLGQVSGQSERRSSGQFTQMIAGNALQTWQQTARQAAIAANVPTSDLDWLLLQVCDLDRLSLRLGTFRDRVILAEYSLPELEELWQRRLTDRVPVQQLAGRVQWRSLELRVSADVLIPRPETELLVDLAIETVQRGASLAGNWLDLGTGSGAIAIGLATELRSRLKPSSRNANSSHTPPIKTNPFHVYAVDCSAAALAIAQDNCDRCGVGDWVTLQQGSWFEPFRSQSALKFQAIVSNPPYIPRADLADLEPEVRDHDPVLALDGGESGLEDLWAIVQAAPEFLLPGGWLFLEHEARQGEAMRSALHGVGVYGQIATVQDWAGFDRFTIGQYTPGI